MKSDQPCATLVFTACVAIIGIGQILVGDVADLYDRDVGTPCDLAQYLGKIIGRARRHAAVTGISGTVAGDDQCLLRQHIIGYVQHDVVLPLQGCYQVFWRPRLCIQLVAFLGDAGDVPAAGGGVVEWLPFHCIVIADQRVSGCSMVCVVTDGWIRDRRCRCSRAGQ